MSFHEKSAWACLGAILLVYIPFFLLVFSTPGYPVVVGAFVGSVVAMVAILVTVHIVFAISSKRIRETGDVPPLDEMEVGIELRAMKIASFLLASIVILWCIVAYVGIPVSGITDLVQQATAAAADPETAEAFAPNPSIEGLLPVSGHDALFAVHVLFAGFVLANVVYYASIVTGYRRAV